MTGAALVAAASRGLPVAQSFRAAPAVFLLLAGFFAFAAPSFRDALAGWFAGSPTRAVLAAQAITLPYLLYAIPLGRFAGRDWAALLLYVNLPVAVLLLGKLRGFLLLSDFGALLLIWLPLELAWLPPLWSWPPGQSGRFLHGFLGSMVALYCFETIRSLPGIGFTFRCRRADWRIAAWALLAFLPIAIPLGALTGFLGWAGWPSSPLAALARVAGGFLATSLPEELLFRGLLQNLLRRWTGRPWLSLAIASVCFGAAHWNVGVHADWRLPLLATLAGVAYGWAYQAGGTLMAPALTHTFVNALWMILFRR